MEAKGRKEQEPGGVEWQGMRSDRWHKARSCRALL